MTNKNSKCMVIAEIGLNHNGKYDLAEKSIIAAAKAGADAVKFQNYTTEDFLTDKSILHKYKNEDKFIEEPLFDICKRSEFQEEWLPSLISLARSLGLIFLSTPTSIAGVDLLIKHGVKHIKNGSDFLSHIPLLRHMASTGANIIISTGMAYEKDIDEAVDAILRLQPDKTKLTILHCTSSYPTSIDNVNLNKITSLRNRYKVNIGFSDHTEGFFSAIQAVSMGVNIIEKHFTIDKTLSGPDHWFSSSPEEFEELVFQIRLAESRLGFKELRPAESEMDDRKQWRLGLFWKRNMEVGETIVLNDIDIRKPSSNLAPKELDTIIGKKIINRTYKSKSVEKSDILKDSND
jgi:N,N'-diacetyllegionaminate synthase